MKQRTKILTIKASEWRSCVCAHAQKCEHKCQSCEKNNVIILKASVAFMQCIVGNGLE